MNAIRLLSLLSLLAVAGIANASSFVATTDAVGRALVASAQATSDVSSTVGDDKVVLAARDDAAAFVASQGSIRGVQLEAAVQHIRQQAPALQSDDMQLASAILSL